MTNHKPATALPWTIVGGPHAKEIHDACGVCVDSIDRASWGDGWRIALADLQYKAHSANAYPKLVEALRFVITGDWPTNPLNPVDHATALLRELGELK